VIGADGHHQPFGGVPQPLPRRLPLSVLGEADRVVDLGRQGMRMFRAEDLAQFVGGVGGGGPGGGQLAEGPFGRRPVAQRGQRVRVPPRRAAWRRRAGRRCAATPPR
jgi:hypothetical protein